MLKAKLTQVKDIMYEVIPGFLPTHVIYDNMREIDEDVKYTAVSEYYQIIKQSIPQTWRSLITSNIKSKRESKFPHLKIAHGKELKDFCMIK